MTKQIDFPKMNDKIEGTTDGGFAFSIETRRLDNYLLLRYIGKVDSGDVQAVDKLLDLLFGPEQAEKFIDFLIEEDGILPNEKLFGEIKSVFAQVEKLKK